MREREIRLAAGLGSIIGLLVIANGAFSKKVRKEIGKRDKWHCQDDCDRSFATGFMVHAAHDPKHHHKSDPAYNDASSGSIRCIEHHMDQHLNGTTLKPHQDDYAARQLEQTDERTRWWRKSKR